MRLLQRLFPSFDQQSGNGSSACPPLDCHDSTILVHDLFENIGSTMLKKAAPLCECPPPEGKF